MCSYSECRQCNWSANERLRDRAATIARRGGGGGWRRGREDGESKETEKETNWGRGLERRRGEKEEREWEMERERQTWKQIQRQKGGETNRSQLNVMVGVYVPL